MAPLHLSVLFSISCHCYKTAQHFLNFHPLFNRRVQGWVSLARAHEHRAKKSPFLFSFFFPRNMVLFFFQTVTELIWRKKSFCLELARALYSSRERRACRRHLQMMSSTNVLYLQLWKLLAGAHLLSARFPSSRPSTAPIGLAAAALQLLISFLPLLWPLFLSLSSWLPSCILHSAKRDHNRS